MGLATTMAAAMLVFGLGGHWLDARAGRGGAGWTIAGLFLGLAYCAYEVWKLVRDINKGPGGRGGEPPARRGEDRRE